MKKWLQILRVGEYIKNLLVFFPAFFGGKLFEHGNFQQLVFTFIVFCFLSSAIYIINDLFDKQFDNKHPFKKSKHIASGRISVREAIAVALFLLVLVMGLSSLISLQFLGVCIVYLLTNLFYSSLGKHIPLLDLLLITFGFLLRLEAGSIVTEVVISNWLYAMNFLLAIGFGLSKRLNEIRLLALNQIDASEVRPSLKYYSVPVAQYGIILIVGCATVCYMFYTISPETTERLQSKLIFVTCIPVLVGVFRYIRLVKEEARNVMPQYVLKHDRLIQVSIGFWIVMMAFFIYW